MFTSQQLADGMPRLIRDCSSGRERPVLPSTSGLIFVLNPPRERPTAWLGGSMLGFLSFDPSPFVARDVGRVLMRAGDPGVHRERAIHQPGAVRGRGQQPQS